MMSNQPELASLFFAAQTFTMMQEERSNLWRIVEKAMAPHSSTLVWKIPWMEEPGRLQSMGSLRVETTERLHFHFSLSCMGEGNGNPLQYSCLENPRDGGAWWAAVYGVTQSRTQLKRLSSSSSSVENRHASFLGLSGTTQIQGTFVYQPPSPPPNISPTQASPE